MYIFLFMAERAGASPREDVRSVVWWVLVGAGGGAIAGFVVGGIGGRLAMLLLRVTSPDSLRGSLSDDGFEIGVVTLDTVQLLLSMAMLGAANGILYAAVRSAIPGRLRLPLWTLLAATAGGASFVHEDGIDFQLIEPVLLAILLFVALPAVAAALVVVLVERWIGRVPGESPTLVKTLVVAAIAGTFALVLAVLVGGVAVAIRRAGASALVGRVARVAVPVGIVAVAAYAGVDLVSEASRIL